MAAEFCSLMAFILKQGDSDDYSKGDEVWFNTCSNFLGTLTKNNKTAFLRKEA